MDISRGVIFIRIPVLATLPSIGLVTVDLDEPG